MIQFQSIVMLTKNVEKVLQSILKVENTFLGMEKLVLVAGNFLKKTKVMKMISGIYLDFEVNFVTKLLFSWLFW